VSDGLRFPWDMPAIPVAPPAARDPDAQAARPKPRGRRPTSAIRAAEHAREGAAARDAPDWLFHHLTISGPAAAVDDFAAAARGSGVTPWQLDISDVEETVFNLAVSRPPTQRNLTVKGCRILARQFRERVEMRQARAAEQIGRSFVCPFDLHALLPVPAPILQLGPTHPDALIWLAAHWGVTDRLRQVVVRDNATAGRRLPKAHALIGYSFFTHRETPDAAIGQLGARWPMLGFVRQHRSLD
jgi:hypothetical protein